MRRARSVLSGDSSFHASRCLNAHVPLTAPPQVGADGGNGRPVACVITCV